MGDGFDRDDLALLAELATPVADGGCSFCGVTLQEYAIGNVTHQWPRGSHLRWLPAFDDLGAVRSEQVRTAFTAALKEISDCCDVTHEMVSAEHKANLVITIHRLDGKSGVLGDCGIPMGNADPDRMQLRMRLDTSERWGLSENPVGDLIDLYRVFLHEAEHFHGLGHKPTSIRDPALIAPMYSPSIRNLQPADKGELLRRYGQPKVAPPPPPPPTGTAPTSIPVRVSIEAHGGVYEAAGSAKRKVSQPIYADRYPTGPVILPPFVEMPEDHLGDTEMEGEIG
jgi:hypothetical protein